MPSKHRNGGDAGDWMFDMRRAGEAWSRPAFFVGCWVGRRIVGLQIRPITFRAACEFVKSLHRHNKPPQGHKFSIAVAQTDTNETVGVAMCGRPIARHFDDGLTIEVNRTCTDGSKNANSLLYGACWRAAKAMGYRRIITYTQHDESGASLRAAGFVKVKDLPERKSWRESSVKHRSLRAEDVNGGVARVLWEIRCEQ